MCGCIGALDGIAARIKKPRNQECRDPAGYHHRKGFYAIPLQAICVSNYRLIFKSAKCASPTHDYVALAVSSFDADIQDIGLPNGYWIAADDAYHCDDLIITPVPKNRSPPDSPEDGFKFYMSSYRKHIDQSFGMLMACWGILWRPLQFNLRQNVRIITLGMLLHNFCIQLKDSSTEDIVNSNEHNEILTFTRNMMTASSDTPSYGEGVPGRRCNHSTSSTRSNLVKVVRELGYTRPSTNATS